MIIPIGITAKDEASSLPRMLESLRRSVNYAEARLVAQFEIHVLLNDNNDDSEEFLANQKDIHVWLTTGGIVEAQRFFKQIRPDSPFLVFSDADILLDENCIYELTQAMLVHGLVEVAYADKYPLSPRRKSPLLARALYFYNLNNGYQNQRHYFNGQLFAIRNWSIPLAKNLSWSAEQNNNFLNLDKGIRCDDIFLSRDLLERFGPESIHCANAAIWYRPPETLRGMYRKYQRMVLEIERLNCFFPNTIQTHNNLGRRQLQKKEILSRPFAEIGHYGIFLVALYICKLWYQIEKFYYANISKQHCPTWKPVLETKDLS